MSELNSGLVDSIVKQVMQELEGRGAVSGTPATGSQVTNGIFENANDAIEAAKVAQKVWVRTPRKTKENVIAALRQAMHDNAEEFARQGQAETGMGRVKHKILKHHNAADATPGNTICPGS
ncbi:aldehyde dehydrogenase family protein [bacterium]|nr:aldehyde dehydrogenase family protein [bacterium]